ncbi:hypothetical protein OROGR_033054 [Orobanche gracilis]
MKCFSFISPVQTRLCGFQTSHQTLPFFSFSINESNPALLLLFIE